MTDLIVTLYYLPLTTYHLLSHVLQVILLLPWPSGGEIFGSFVVFLILWYPRRMMEKSFLEKTYYKRRKSTPPPTSSDHMAAASSISSMFLHR